MPNVRRRASMTVAKSTALPQSTALFLRELHICNKEMSAVHSLASARSVNCVMKRSTSPDPSKVGGVNLTRV